MSSGTYTWFNTVVANTFLNKEVSRSFKQWLWQDPGFMVSVLLWDRADGEEKRRRYHQLITWIEQQQAAYVEPECCLDSNSKDVEESTYTSVINW